MPPSAPTTHAATAARSAALAALFEHLVDYAGLFPPAKLDMQRAVENYGDYTRGGFEWMLGKFILPASRLDEFEAAISTTASSLPEWTLSVLLGPDVAADMKLVGDFDERHRGKFSVESVELKANTPSEIQTAHAFIPQHLPAFFEIPLDAEVESCISTIAQCKRNAKMRTGGENPGMIPSSDAIARFIHACSERGVAFKATAGLHHPIRSTHRLTYAADSPSAMMHGFLNVFLGAAFLSGRAIGPEEAGELLDDTSAPSFTVTEDAITWRSHRLTANQIRGSRRSFAMSFGSCSFTEPIEDLRALALL